MTLDELVQAVLDRTKRADKANEIKLSVRKAIRMVHTSAYFPRDIVEEEVDLTATFQKFKIPLPPRVRKFQALAPLDINGNPIRITTNDNLYEYVSAAEVINSFFESKLDIYYVAGAVLTVKSSVGARKLYMSFYAYPEFSDGNLETWLMKDNETVFIDAALSDFYNSIGRQQQANQHKSEFVGQLRGIIDDNVHMEGD